MVRTATTLGRLAVLAVLGAASALLTGCSSMQVPQVEEVASTFEDPGADPRTRCDLLAPATLVAFEQDEEASCAEAIQQVPLGGVARSSRWRSGAATPKCGWAATPSS